MRAVVVVGLWAALVLGVFFMWRADQPTPEDRPAAEEPSGARLEEVRRNCAVEIEALAARPARQREIEEICAERIAILEAELQDVAAG